MLNYIHGIVAYIFLNIRKKIHQLLSSVKKCTQKKIGSFFPPYGVEYSIKFGHVFLDMRELADIQTDSHTCL